MLRLVFTLAVSVWLGTVVCISFIVTPIAHGSFPSQEARRFLRPIFPPFYTLGVVCGLAALAVVVLGRTGITREELIRLAGPVVIALGATLTAREWLLPQLRELDGSDPSFARLHQASAMLNTATLGALVLALAAAVARP